MPRSVNTSRSTSPRGAQSKALALATGQSLAQRAIRAILADPARSIAMSLLVTACITTSINALYLQTIKHPAPLFGQVDAPAAVMPDPVPVPVARSTAFSTALADIDETTLTAGGFAPNAAPVTALPAPKPETIGDLISSTGPKPPAPNKTVLAAQKALNKIGYAVKADGIIGGTTRQAVEKFERDNRLPIKGDLSPKILRELSMAAGMPVE